MAENKNVAVWFNEEAQEIYEILKREGFTSQPFPEFVKGAFYDKVDDLRNKRSELSVETIEKLAIEAVKKAAAKNL